MKTTRSKSGMNSSKAALPSSGRTFTIPVCLITMAFARHVIAAEPSADLTRLSLEDLMNVQVTSVSKKSEKLSAAPAPVYVISSEDIRRSGATSIPEALRMVPGLQVAKVDAHNWAISARGFNDVFANKLLVMVDGRSIYTPLFSGVFWDARSLLLDDVDHIEVMRGPGGTTWGANAVNGVISITTRSAAETQGTLLSLGGGTENPGMAAVRHGGKLGDDAFYRVYLKYDGRDDSAIPGGAAANDKSQLGRGGFRIDWTPSDVSQFTFQGDTYGGKINQTFSTITPTAAPRTVQDSYGVLGGNLLGRWTREIDATSRIQLQAYYDGTSRDTAIFKEQRHTADVDLQYRFELGDRHEFLWGAGYRGSYDSIGNTYTVSYFPTHDTTHLFNTVIEDSITLVPDHWKLILGARVEHSDYTGFEFQPGIRLLWTPTEKFTAFASVARAVRTPSRAENGVTINTAGPVPGTIASIRGSTGFESENLVAYDLGVRAQPIERLSLDLSLFYNVYDDLRTLEPGVPAGVPPVIPLTASNQLEGETYGIETGPRWQVCDWWLLQASYSFIQMQLHTKPGSRSRTAETAEGQTPHHQAGLRSYINISPQWDFDAGVRYVGALSGIGIGSYTEADIRIAWRPKPGLEISVVGQNLIHSQHPEFRPSLIPTQAAEVERAVYGKITWHF